MKEKRKVKMTFEVIVDYDLMVDDDSLVDDYKGDIHRVAKYLYKSEGLWWDEQLKLIKTEIIQ